MQPTISLRDAIVATIILSPAFISGLALPWDFRNALAARSPVLSGGVVDSFAHEVRASDNTNAKRSSKGGSQSGSGDESADAPTVTGMPSGGASGFPQPTGGFGSFGSGGGGSGCGSAPFPSGTGSPFGQGSGMKKVKANNADAAAFPSGSMPTGAPTGCGGFGAGPTGQAGPTGGPSRS